MRRRIVSSTAKNDPEPAKEHKDVREELKLSACNKCLVALIIILIIVAMIFAILVYFQAHSIRLQLENTSATTTIAANVSNAIEQFRKRNTKIVN